MSKQTILTADTVVHVETSVKASKRVLDYADILDACRVEYDENMRDAPWENSDGLEHEFERMDYVEHDDIRQAAGWVGSNSGRSGLITISDAQVRKWGFTPEHFPGMAKQPLAELAAAEKRRTIEQLVKYYEDGWQWYVVLCQVKVGEDGIEACDWRSAEYTDSLGGIDSEEYAQECCKDVALNVTAELEADGYIVENQPPAYDARAAKLSSMKDRIKRQLARA